MWNLLPLLISAGGTAVQMSAEQSAEKRRIREAEANRQQLALKQREADERVNAEIENVQASTPEQEREKANSDFLMQLRRTRGDAVASSGVGGERYQSDIVGAAGDVDRYGRDRAGVLARIAAPVRQRTNEATGMSRLATDLNTISRFASGDDFLSQMRQANIRANPWAVAGGQLMQGVGSGMAESGFGMGGGVWDDGTRSSGMTAAQRRNNFGYKKAG